MRIELFGLQFSIEKPNRLIAIDGHSYINPSRIYIDKYRRRVLRAIPIESGSKIPAIRKLRELAVDTADHRLRLISAKEIVERWGY